MARIFISYSRVDETFARQIADDLLRLGADVWIDVDDIRAGLSWADSIQEGLDACDVMIIVIAPESMASKNVADEWQYYVEERRPIIPVYLRKASVHYQLRRLQYVDFLHQDYNTAFAQLHSELRRKGVRLAPISARDESVAIPAQAPLPERDGGGVPRAVWAIGAAVALLIVAAVVIAVLSLLAGGDDGDDPSATPDPLVMASDPSDTPTATETPATATETPRPTDTHTPTPEPTETPRPTDTHTLPERARTFSGGNDDWEPFVQDFNGVEMVLAPAGCFMMGSDQAQISAAFDQCEMERGIGNCERSWFEDEYPPHRVCFDRPFWIDRYEVTNAQYGSIGCEPYSTSPDQPRNCVDWFAARNFCEARGARLPTEAEWEYVARGPNGWVYPWGNVFLDDNAVYSRNSGGTAARVGSKPNGVSWVGTFDMSGNVWEWVADWYVPNYYRTLENGVVNPTGPSTGIKRLFRGGSWAIGPSDDLRSSFRSSWDASVTYNNVGFRCARDID